MSTLTKRMIGAAKLQSATYEEVEADTTATGQAMTVVLLSALAAGLGVAGAGVRGMVAVTLAGLFGWLVWAWLAWFVGTKILPTPATQSDMGELLRTVGFSASPGILRIFGFVPIVGPLIQGVASIWMLLTMVVAVRQALDYTSTLRAVAVCFVGWIIYIAIFMAVGMVLGMGSFLMGGGTPGV
jgi:hypothetical protein